MDQMVVNDQAHDAFAGEGLRLNNTVEYQGKDTGGTGRDLAKVTTDDIALFGDTSLTENAVQTRAKARAYINAAQENLADATYVKVLLDTESYDIGSIFSVGANKFTTIVAGYYLVCAQIGFAGLIANARLRTGIFVSGSLVSNNQFYTPDGNSVFVGVSDILYVGAGVDIELYARQVTGTATVDLVSDNKTTFMSVHLLSI